MLKIISNNFKNNRRLFIVAMFIILLSSILLGRLIFLQVVQKQFLQQQGDSRTIRKVSLKSLRGSIFDRAGNPLAMSMPVITIWANPKKLKLDSPNIETMLNILKLSKNQLKNNLIKYQNHEFMYLKRKVEPTIAKKVLNLQIPGIYSQDDYRRYYPIADVSAQIIGFTNIDEQGLEGLEKVFDDTLVGKDGHKTILVDRLGREVELLENYLAPVAGQDLILSLDQRLQALAFKAVKDAVNKHQATSGCAVVLDSNSCEVLAMVNYPSFNPNSRNKKAQLATLRNQAVTNVFEPASSIKAFSMASVLDSGKYNLDTMIDTAPGFYKVHGGVVKDLANYGKLNLTQVLKNSSNIGIAKLVLELPHGALLEMYDRLGFGQLTGSNFPGESKGIITMPKAEQAFVLATMAFGYGLAVTPLQLARAYTVIGSYGLKRNVSFIKQNNPVAGERVMSADVAKNVLYMLTEVVQNPKSYAKVSGYLVAGKSGTARKLGKMGYDASRHKAVFAGLAPALNPKFSIVVTIDEPKSGEFYGNQIAAPVFSKIASEALRLFNVHPDQRRPEEIIIALKSGNN